MASRKTETRIPDGLQPADLGQFVTAADSRCCLVSFVTSPLAVNRNNVYVVFITDAALAVAAASFEWSIVLGGGAPQVQTTPFGELVYTANAGGSLQISVRILDSGSTEQASLSIAQDIADPNAELEALITEAVSQPGPGAASPDVLRELINEHNLYYQGVIPTAAEAGDGYKRLVFNMTYDGALVRDAGSRKAHLDEIARSLNTDAPDFATVSADRAGVCGVRPVLLAMSIPGMLTWQLLPADNNQRIAAEDNLRQSLALLDETKRIDLFNILRFPKSNITYCGRVLETLRDNYFPGTNFNDVLTGMSGTRAQWIITQFQTGPVTRT